MGLFGFNAEKKLKKGQQFLAGGLAYEARMAFEEILLRDKMEEPILAEARKGWVEARTLLMREQIAEATELLRAGDRAGARESCRAAIEQAGTDLDAAEARKMLAELEKGESAAAKMLEGLDEIPDATRVVAEQADDEDAVASGPEALFDVLLQPLPEEHAEAYRGFGPEFRDAFLLLQDGEAEQALEAFGRIPEETAAHPYVQLERAQALMVARQNEEALERLTGLDLPPDLERRAREMRIVLLQRLERGEEAEKEARALFEAAPEDLEAKLFYAEVLLDNDKGQEGLDLVLPLRGGQSVPEIDRLVVRGYVQTDRIDDARELLETTVEGFFQSPGGLHARFPVWAARDLLNVYITIGEEPKRVRALVQHLIGHDPPNAERYKEALASYVEAREKAEKEEGSEG
ncbi:MAG: hypothetical protein GF346_10765 [Candidatus Eisenbacteria bacterium]|nr:hypothetical protein [Candidatus Latescibacterota bacterium]MBD3302919.1 hypothetical protein [Candidatus Eisenbacteria bacterium]